MTMIQGLPNLSIGAKTAETGNWQRFLRGLGYADWAGVPVQVDEDFGQKTAYSTRQWQVRSGLAPSAEVGPKEREAAYAQGFLPFVQAKGYNLLYPKVRAIRVIVIHTMENPEKPDSAENVALWFAGKSAAPAPMASAHYCLDSDSTVQCVRDMDIAWHAPGVNNDGIGIEHAGYAKQSPVEWMDAPSRAILWRSARLVARLCTLYDIPIVKLSADDLKAGAKGICGHADVSAAYPGPGRTHWDPGPSFPWSHYAALVGASQQAPQVTADPTGPNDPVT